MSLWKRIRHRMETAALRFLAWWIPTLSRSQCLRLANALGALGARFDRRGRAVALANVECAFGDRFSAAQMEEIVRASYQNFARAMLDLFWSPALARPENRHWLRLSGWEELKARSARVFSPCFEGSITAPLHSVLSTAMSPPLRTSLRQAS